MHLLDFAVEMKLLHFMWVTFTDNNCSKSDKTMNHSLPTSGSESQVSLTRPWETGYNRNPSVVMDDNLTWSWVNRFQAYSQHLKARSTMGKWWLGNRYQNSRSQAKVHDKFTASLTIDSKSPISWKKGAIAHKLRPGQFLEKGGPFWKRF